MTKQSLLKLLDSLNIEQIREFELSYLDSDNNIINVSFDD